MDLKHVICKESLFSSKRGEVYKAMDKAGVKSTQARCAARPALMTMHGIGVWVAQLLAMYILSQKFAKKSAFKTWLSVLPTQFDSPGRSPSLLAGNEGAAAL